MKKINNDEQLFYCLSLYGCLEKNKDNLKSNHIELEYFNESQNKQDTIELHKFKFIGTEEKSIEGAFNYIISTFAMMKRDSDGSDYRENMKNLRDKYLNNKCQCK